MKKARSEVQNISCQAPAIVATSQNPESVVAAVASLFVDPLFSDTTISAEDGKEWRCHKNILAASSSVFLTLYNSGLKESKSSVVLISDTTSAAIDCLLGYVYTGRLACGIESVVDVLELSHRFQVDSLHSAVERVLENSISDDTCCELINSCSRWSKQFETCRNIWTRCLEHLAAFFHRIWKLDSFLALEYHSFTNLLETFGKSVVCDIEDMNQAISRWASHDKETRVVHLAELNRLAVSERKDIPKDVKSYSVLKEGSISTHPSVRCGDLVCHFDEMSPDVSSFLVPRDGFYYILAAGGKAGDCTNTIGGSGAFIGGLLWLNGGEAIRASIGHRSKDNYGGGSAGGDATYIIDGEGSPLVVAGGGGGGQGGDNVYSVDGKDAELFVSGSRGAGSNQAPGGTSGMNGGSSDGCSEGGDGFFEAVHGCPDHHTNGKDSTLATSFRSLRGGRAGRRGFGGGGAGYSGGGGGMGGGGGGSFVCPQAIEEIRAKGNSSHGWMKIYYGWLPVQEKEKLNNESCLSPRGYDGLEWEWHGLLPGF